MANHSYNTTFIYGPEEDLKRLSDRVDTNLPKTISMSFLL